MTARLCIAILIGALAARLALAVDRPVAVEIVAVPAEMRDTGCRIGNVRVSFMDGRSELWTKRGRCLLAKISRGGMVGWTRYGYRNRRGAPVNDTVRLMVSNDRWVDFRSGYPFIDNWDTSQDGSRLMVQSGLAHGPRRFELFDVPSQRLLEQIVEKPFAELPDWARTLATDAPRP